MQMTAMLLGMTELLAPHEHTWPVLRAMYDAAWRRTTAKPGQQLPACNINTSSDSIASSSSEDNDSFHDSMSDDDRDGPYGHLAQARVDFDADHHAPYPMPAEPQRDGLLHLLPPPPPPRELSTLQLPSHPRASQPHADGAARVQEPDAGSASLCALLR